MYLLKIFFSILFIFLYLYPAAAQEDLLEWMDKPIGFERRKLSSENTPRRKNTAARRAYFDVVTYFNFYFNAKDRMNDIEQNALNQKTQELFSDTIDIENINEKYLLAHKDYLDTIIEKCNAGILLHDLNNHWVDDLLLLMGKAYYYKQSYDTAYTIFHYINKTFGEQHSAYLYEGRQDENGNLVFDKISIVIPEKKSNWFLDVFRNPYEAKNDAMVWLIKTMIHQNKINAALSLSNLLSKDANFPDRLKIELYNINGMLNYEKGNYYAAANILEKAIDYYPKRNYNWLALKAITVAKIYEKARFSQYAYQMYIRAAQFARKPLLKMQAQIAALGLDYIQYLERDIDNILKNPRYKLYRSIALYSIAIKLYNLNKLSLSEQYAKMAIELKNLDIEKRQELLVLLAKVNLSNKQYLVAGLYIEEAHLPNAILPEKYKINNYLNVIDLGKRYNDINRYDSLLSLAKLPGSELEKRIRSLALTISIKETNEKTILQPNNEKDKNQNNWYFDNPKMMRQGEEAFFEKYGQRPNVDNWQRKNALFQSAINIKDNVDESTNLKNSPYKKESVHDILWNTIPLSVSKKKLMQDSLHSALYFYAVDIYTIANDIPTAQKAMKRIHTIDSSYSMNEISFMKIIGLSPDEHIVRKAQNKQQVEESQYIAILNAFQESNPALCLHLINNMKNIESKIANQIQFMKACSLYQTGEKKESIKLLNELLKKTTNPDMQDRINLLLSYYDQVVTKNAYNNP